MEDVKSYTYRGVKVKIPYTADMPRYLRPDGRQAEAVQTVLDQIEPWKEYEGPVEETRRVSTALRVTVIPNEGDSPFWAIHRGHKAKRPKLSPFLKMEKWPETKQLTIELTGTPEQPLLIRAYPGDTYLPPLPWQKSSVKDAPGGYEECVMFWSTHSYLFYAGLIEPGSSTNTSPDWFRP